MSNHEEHHHDKPKRVYFGIPFGFALTFWFIIFLCLKACDGGSKPNCCKEEGECSKECRAKCEAEGKTNCHEKEGVAEEKKDDVIEEKKEDASPKEGEVKAEEKPANEENTK
jgi:hypothetical protein